MIINFHPKEIESKKGLDVIKNIVATNHQEVFHVTDKTKEEWQAVIKGSEKLVLVAPVYWWGASYEFDKWLQEVFSYGFAYEYQNGMPVGLLNKRAFEMHLTHGTPTAFAGVMQENIKTRLEKGVFGFNDASVAISFYDLA